MKSEGKIHVVVTNSNALVDTKGTLASAAQAIPYFGEAFSSAVGSSSVHVVPWDARVFTPGAEGHLMDLDSLIKLSGIGDQNFTSIELLTNATVQTKRFADILIAVTSLEIEKLCTESFRAVLATRRSA